jgi:hypothetical protein
LRVLKSLLELAVLFADGNIRCLREHLGPLEHEGCVSPLESGREIDVLRNNASIEQTEHTIRDVVLCDGGRVSEGVVPEILGEDALGMRHFLPLDVADTQSL